MAQTADGQTRADARRDRETPRPRRSRASLGGVDRPKSVYSGDDVKTDARAQLLEFSLATARRSGIVYCLSQTQGKRRVVAARERFRCMRCRSRRPVGRRGGVRIRTVSCATTAVWCGGATIRVRNGHRQATCGTSRISSCEEHRIVLPGGRPAAPPRRPPPKRDGVWPADVVRHGPAMIDQSKATTASSVAKRDKLASAARLVRSDACRRNSPCSSISVRMRGRAAATATSLEPTGQGARPSRHKRLAVVRVPERPALRHGSWSSRFCSAKRERQNRQSTGTIRMSTFGIGAN